MAFLKRIGFPEAAAEDEVSPPSGPRSAGYALRRRREELELSLDEVGEALRIKPAYLAALEEGRPDSLPGSAYAVGFLKSYGEYLGLDGAEVVRRFKAESAGLDTKPDLSFPMPLGERSVPGGGTLLVALILVACGYGAWYYLSTGEHLRPQRVSELPATLMASKPLRAHAAATPVATPAGPPAATPQSAEQPAPSPRAAAASAAPRPAAATGAGPPAAAAPATAASAVAPMPAAASPSEPTPAVSLPATAATPTEKTPAARPVATATAAPKPPAASASGADASRIVIRATADSWVQVRDATGTVLFTRILKAGDSYRVPDQPGITMDTGNAGGLSLSLDRNPLPPLGGNGEVRRHIALDPAALAAADKPRTD